MLDNGIILIKDHVQRTARTAENAQGFRYDYAFWKTKEHIKNPYSCLLAVIRAMDDSGVRRIEIIKGE